jgi:hypothetical protein
MQEKNSLAQKTQRKMVSCAYKPDAQAKEKVSPSLARQACYEWYLNRMAPISPMRDQR